MSKTLEDYILEGYVLASLDDVLPDKENVRQHFTIKELEVTYSK